MHAQPASLNSRFFAWVIDSIIVMVVSFSVSFIAAIIFSDLIALFLTLVFSSLYYLYPTWKYGQTLGKRIAHIKVINQEAEVPSVGRVLLRETIGKAASRIFSLGYLWIYIDKNRQGWHDKLAKTYVIAVDKKSNPIPFTTTPKKHWFLFIILVFTIGFPGLILATFLFTYIFLMQPFQISGQSMRPTYNSGTYVLGEKVSYYTNDPQRGDIVILRAPEAANCPSNAGCNFIERVVGVPGDELSLVNGEVMVNGEVLEENYLSPGTKTLPGQFLSAGETITIPEDHYFTMGDNRPYASDSRSWGLVPEENIISRIFVCYWKCSK